MTPEFLKTILDYNPDTGAFTWKLRTNNVVWVGKRAGYLMPTGYRSIQIGGKLHLEHRLAWFHVYGKFPKECIDHIDGVRDNNRISNLREASMAQNSHNKRSALPLKGAFKTFNGRWRSRIRFGLKNLHLGYYDTPEQAHTAYVTAAKQYYGEFARSA